MFFACDVAPPGIGSESFLPRLAVSGVAAFSDEGAPKLRKATTWQRRGARELSNAEIRRALAAAVAELQPIDYRNQLFAAKVKWPLPLDGPLVGAWSGRR